MFIFYTHIYHKYTGNPSKIHYTISIPLLYPIYSLFIPYLSLLYTIYHKYTIIIAYIPLL